MNIFDKFNEKINTEELKKNLGELAKNDTEFEDVPRGTYDVKIEKMEIKESKSSGSPMFSCWFKILDGDQEGHLIFMNQIITQAFQIHIVNEFLRDLDSGLDVNFEDYSQYNELILDIHEVIADKIGYGLVYGQSSKGYNTFKIKDSFDL